MVPNMSSADEEVTLPMDDYIPLRRVFTTKVNQLKASLADKKSFSKKFVVQCLDELLDLVVTHDFSTGPRTVRMSDGSQALNIFHRSYQPMLNVPKINGSDNWRDIERANNSGDKMAAKNSTNKIQANKVAENGVTGEPSTSRPTGVRSMSTSESAASESSDGVRYKGKIVGLDSIKNDDEEEPSPKKRKPQTRGSRGRTSEPKKAKEDKKSSANTSFTSGGKRLGGNSDTQNDSSEISPEERRQLLLRATEQRVNQTSGRQSRARRAPAELPDGPKDGPLRWKV